MPGRGRVIHTRLTYSPDFRFALAAGLGGLRFVGVSKQVLKFGAQGVSEEVDVLKFQKSAANPIQAPAGSLRGRECKKLLGVV